MTGSPTYTLLCPGCISALLYGPIMTMTAIWTCCCQVQQALSSGPFQEHNCSEMMAGIPSLLFRARCRTCGTALLCGVTSTTMVIWTCCSVEELTPQVSGV